PTPSAVRARAPLPANCAPHPSTSGGARPAAPPRRAAARANARRAWLQGSRTGTSAILRWRAWVGRLRWFGRLEDCAMRAPLATPEERQAFDLARSFVGKPQTPVGAQGPHKSRRASCAPEATAKAKRRTPAASLPCAQG